MYIVGFNGPPRSGKDTLAALVAKTLEDNSTNLAVKQEALSLPLRQTAYALTDYRGELQGPDYETFKTTQFFQFSAFTGITGRRLMIDISESFLKPTYGTGVLARMLLQRNAGFLGILLVADIGFQTEVGALAEGVGQDNLFLVRVNRPGFTFEGDSRERTYATNDTEVQNDGGLEELAAAARRIFYTMTTGPVWTLD